MNHDTNSGMSAGVTGSPLHVITAADQQLTSYEIRHARKVLPKHDISALADLRLRTEMRQRARYLAQQARRAAQAQLGDKEDVISISSVSPVHIEAYLIRPGQKLTFKHGAKKFHVSLVESPVGA